jgi:single-strand DNA-binding protein
VYLNKAFIIGNLTRDPELKSLPSGMHVATFGVATNRVWRDKNGARQDATEFHNIVVFGRQAETAAQYLKKGNGVLIEGRIQTRSWDGQDGQKRYRTEIVAERVQFGPKGSGGGVVPAAGPKETVPEKKGEPDAIEYPTEEIKAEDIPF